MKPQLLFIVLFFSFCNQIENLSYEIKSINNLENVDTKLSIGIENKLNSKTELTFQFFPKNPDNIESYLLVFDMTFREDYQNDFNDVCVGPSWTKFGPGEFSIKLDKKSNFKNSIVGIIDKNFSDRCDTYFFYMRSLEIQLKDNKTILIGVASDYANKYPDAPNIWIRNHLGEIQEIGTTNIEKYSINFELSN